MTTFRSSTLLPERVTYSEVSSSEPDAIGIEVRAEDGRYILDVMKERSGRISICFGQPPKDSPGWEIELEGFRSILATCLTQIEQWEASLRGSGGIWSDRIP